MYVFTTLFSHCFFTKANILQVFTECLVFVIKAHLGDPLVYDDYRRGHHNRDKCKQCFTVFDY